VPKNTASLRRANLSRVLGFLRERGPHSRAAIASGTGLHKATVSTLVDELLARRLVRQKGLEQSGAAGRPGQVLALHGSGVGALGVEINVDYLAIYATDVAGRVLVRRRIGFDAAKAGPQRSVARLAREIREALVDMAHHGASPAGIVIAVPGLVDVATGTVLFAPNLAWRDLPLVAKLTDRLGDISIPVRVDNDANLAAVAEYTYGVAAGSQHLVYLTGEVGVGGGVIVDGSLLRGADGFAGEVGHVPVDPAGQPCGCGRVGCWETKVGLAELVRTALPDEVSGPLRDPAAVAGTVAQRLVDADPIARAAVQQIGRWLGLGGALLVNLFNPRVIVLGGYFVTLAPWLIPAAQAELDRLAVAGDAARCRFVASDLGFAAASRGAASVVVDQIIADPTSVSQPPPNLRTLTVAAVDTSA
jgi:predicted NBD/HSP70 family sugar kinase